MVTPFSPGAESRPVVAVTAPVWPVAVSAATTLLAVGAAVLGSARFGTAVAGYVLGAIVVPALTIAYRFKRQAARRSPYFLPNLPVERLVLGLLCVALAAGVLNAWYVATELAKR